MIARAPLRVTCQYSTLIEVTILCELMKPPPNESIPNVSVIGTHRASRR
jgi:hypothetical protein